MRGRQRLALTLSGITDRSRRAYERLGTERSAQGLVPLEHENFRYRQMLVPTYHDYVSRVSWADHAVSLRTAAVLMQLCESRSPRRLLDTGSGYSSFVLWRYAAQSGAEVVSVDDNATWMSRTQAFLANHDLSDAGRLVLWEQFRHEHPEPFDVIFHDLGTFDTRVSSMSRVSELVSRDGWIVYDDVHEDDVRSATKRIVAAAGRRWVSLVDVTNDEINRYAALSLPR